MVSKRKFKRDYIILEAKDMNFRSKERVLPKAFAKIEVNDEKAILALYVENLKKLPQRNISSLWGSPYFIYDYDSSQPFFSYICQ